MTAPARRLHRGSYQRPNEWPRRVAVGFTRIGGHVSGAWVTLGRHGWYFAIVRARPCRHKRQVDELQRRLDRTVGYLDELLTGPLDETTRTVVDAARQSLVTRASS